MFSMMKKRTTSNASFFHLVIVMGITVCVVTAATTRTTFTSSGNGCKCMPGDLCWPTKQDWSVFTLPFLGNLFRQCLSGLHAMIPPTMQVPVTIFSLSGSGQMCSTNPFICPMCILSLSLSFSTIADHHQFVTAITPHPRLWLPSSPTTAVIPLPHQPRRVLLVHIYAMLLM